MAEVPGRSTSVALPVRVSILSTPRPSLVRAVRVPVLVSAMLDTLHQHHAVDAVQPVDDGAVEQAHAHLGKCVALTQEQLLAAVGIHGQAAGQPAAARC